MKYFLIILLFLLGCSAKSELEQISPNEKDLIKKSDGKYDSFYPTEETSPYLEEIINSIKMINSIAFYDVYYFRKEDRILKNNLEQELSKNNYIENSNFTHTASGTATIIFLENNKIGLITCAHIVDMHDTIITYFREDDGTGTNFVESYFIKKSQSNYVVEFPGSGNIEVILSDKNKDVAYLGMEFSNEKLLSFAPLDYSIGDARELNWGTFTYVIGYPLNFRMVSRAIVSSPTKDNNGSFLLDAVFNRGMSGGAILALRDGVPNFEFIGIIQSVPGDRELLLAPSKKNSILGYNSSVPYKGDAFVEEFRILKYGITKVVTINTIISFFNENETILKNKGFFPTTFLKK